MLKPVASSEGSKFERQTPRPWNLEARKLVTPRCGTSASWPHRISRSGMETAAMLCAAARYSGCGAVRQRFFSAVRTAHSARLPCFASSLPGCHCMVAADRDTRLQRSSGAVGQWAVGSVMKNSFGQCRHVPSSHGIREGSCCLAELTPVRLTTMVVRRCILLQPVGMPRLRFKCSVDHHKCYADHQTLFRSQVAGGQDAASRKGRTLQLLTCLSITCCRCLLETQFVFAFCVFVFFLRLYVVLP